MRLPGQSGLASAEVLDPSSDASNIVEESNVTGPGI
jgi:hypothetical protein